MTAGLTFSIAARNAQVDAILALINTGGAGSLQVGTGTTTDAGFGTVLATIPMAATAFGAASNGTASLNSAPRQDTSADAGGTAAVFRFRNGAGATVFFGICATTDTGADIVLSDIARNAAMDAVDNLINTGSGTATLQFTTAADTTFASSLVSLNLQNPAFGAASSGAISLQGTPTGTASAGGAAGLFRIRDRNNAEVVRGSAGTSGEDINFSPSAVIGQGAPVTLNSYNISLPTTSPSSSAVLVFANGLVFTQGEAVELTSATISMS